MTLTKTYLPILLLLLATARVFSAVTIIDSTSGSIAGSSITYTVSSSNTITINSDGIRTDDDNTVMFMFTDSVDLTIAPHLTNTSAVFSNQSPNNSFAGDAGSWSFISGAQTAGYNPNPWYGFSGSTLTTNRITSGGGHGSGAPNANENWGSFVISGVETLTWNIPDGSNREAFLFSVDATVPEPSGSVLLSFGFLLLIARRKR